MADLGLNLHRLAEERSIELHRAVAEKLGGDAAIIERARERVAGWLESGAVSLPYAVAWAELLKAPSPALAAFLVDPGERARELRQVSPFAGTINPRERWRIWRETRERFEAER